jgi:uncharacterized protein YbjT (DUF2867 family)
MLRKTATVIGSTGLIGSHLIELLQADYSFNTVRVLVRRPLVFKQSKIEMKLVDFNDYESVKLAIDGSDVVFCAVGTTKKKVKGNKEAYRKVDYDIPVNAARFCYETGCQHFSLISSVGANSKSNNFYLKLKGEVEDAVQKFEIPSISFFRPSVLVGKRNEFRLGERVGQFFMKFFAFLLVDKWEKYRPVEAELVAKAMIQAAVEDKRGVNVYEFIDIRKLAKHEFATAHPHRVTRSPF